MYIPGSASLASLSQQCLGPPRRLSPLRSHSSSPPLQVVTGDLEWQLPDGFRMRYHELADELAVGGVYVRLYLKDPRYPLRCAPPAQALWLAAPLARPVPLAVTALPVLHCSQLSPACSLL